VEKWMALIRRSTQLMQLGQKAVSFQRVGLITRFMTISKTSSTRSRNSIEMGGIRMSGALSHACHVLWIFILSTSIVQWRVYGEPPPPPKSVNIAWRRGEEFKDWQRIDTILVYSECEALAIIVNSRPTIVLSKCAIACIWTSAYIVTLCNNRLLNQIVMMLDGIDVIWSLFWLIFVDHRVLCSGQ